MSDARLEKVIQEIQSLSIDQLREINRVVNEKLAEQKADNGQTNGIEINPSSSPRFIGHSTQPPKDRSNEMAWLAENQDEYAGQWVALDGDRLLAHGDKLKDVADAAHKLGVSDALLVRAESTKKPPYVGLWECHTK